MAFNPVPTVAIMRPVAIDPHKTGAGIDVAAVDPNIFFAVPIPAVRNPNCAGTMRPRLDDNHARRRRGDANAHMHTRLGKIRQHHCEQKSSQAFCSRELKIYGEMLKASYRVVCTFWCIRIVPATAGEKLTPRIISQKHSADRKMEGRKIIGMRIKFVC